MSCNETFIAKESQQTIIENSQIPNYKPKSKEKNWYSFNQSIIHGVNDEMEKKF